jgi:hypothetical protein
MVLYLKVTAIVCSGTKYCLHSKQVPPGYARSTRRKATRYHLSALRRSEVNCGSGFATLPGTKYSSQSEEVKTKKNI